MKQRSTSYILLVVLFLLVGCRQHRPYVGEIVVDTDMPNKHNGLLLLGYTLDDGSTARDLLSGELLVDGSFDDGIDAWQPVGGRIDVDQSRSEVETNNKSLLKAIVSSEDSIAGIRQTLSPFPIKKGEQLLFSTKGYSQGEATLEVTIVDDSLFLPLSEPLLFELHEEREEHSGTMTAHKDNERAILQILMTVTPYEYTQYSDSVIYRKSRVATIFLDDLHLQAPDSHVTMDLPSDLVTLLSELQPGFLRYPSGEGAGKELPFHLDSLLHVQKKPIPKFDYKDFIHLSESISATPILLTNFGYNTKPQYISQLIRDISNPNVIIQLGYDQDGLEFFYRFHALEQRLLEDSLTFHIINSGSLLPYMKFSDYPYDRVLSPIRFSSLLDLDSLISEHNFLAEPQMLGEVYFQDSISSRYSVPPLVLRAAFLTIAERNTNYLEGVGVAPLLSTDITKDYPLIQVQGPHYRPTPFYHYIKLFSELRGVDLKSLSAHQPFENGLVLSLTADESGNNYYLKATNTTRHPLPYLIKAKGQKSFFTSVTIHSFSPISRALDSPKRSSTDYEMRSVEQKIGQRQRFDYLFAPYEVVIFHFKQS